MHLVLQVNIDDLDRKRGNRLSYSVDRLGFWIKFEGGEKYYRGVMQFLPDSVIDAQHFYEAQSRAFRYTDDRAIIQLTDFHRSSNRFDYLLFGDFTRRLVRVWHCYGYEEPKSESDYPWSIKIKIEQWAIMMMAFNSFFTLS